MPVKGEQPSTNTTMFTKSRAAVFTAPLRSKRCLQTTSSSVANTTDNRPGHTIEVVKREEALTLEPSEASIREIEEEFDRDGQLPFEKQSGDWNRAGCMTAEYQICSKVELPYGAPGEDRRYGCMKTLKEERLVVDNGDEETGRKPD